MTRYQDMNINRPHILRHLIRLITLALPAVVIWIGVHDRNLQLMKWNPLYGRLYLGLIALALIALLTVFIDTYLRSHRASRSDVGVISYLLALLSLAAAVGMFAYLSPYTVIADKAPQLLLVEQQSDSDYPHVALTWYTLKDQQETLSYGTDPDDLRHTITEEHPSKEHAIIFSEITPGQEIFYRRISDGLTASFTYMPITQSDEGREILRLAIASDAHIGAGSNSEDDTLQILQQITGDRDEYALLFNLGDNVEMGNDDSHYTRQIDLFSPYTTKIPSAVLPGNHDTWFAGVHFWKSYYYPSPLPARSGSRLYHRYDFGPDIHIFTMDLEWGTETYTTDQRVWFEQQLETIDPDDLIIIMSHAFFFASSTKYENKPWYDNQDMIGTFHQLFIDRGVDLVFSGHDHQMEHIHRDGIDYLITGAFGGVKDKQPTFISEGSQYRNFFDSGFADLQIAEDSLTVIFRDTTGDPLYQFSTDR